MKEIEDEKDLSAAQHSQEKDPRVSGSHEIPGRAACDKTKKSQGQETAGGVAGEGSFGFGRDSRLLKKKEYESVFATGRRYRNGRFEYIYSGNDIGRSRLGLVVSRKVGKAVVRNRVKRILREVFRLNKHKLKTDIDLVIRAFPNTSPVTFAEVLAGFVRFAASIRDAKPPHR